MKNIKNRELSLWIFRQTKGYRGKLVFLNAASFVSAALSALFIVFIKSLVDEISAGDLRKFIGCGVFLAAVLIIEAVLGFISDAMSQKVKQDIVVRIRDNLLIHILRCDYGRISKFHTGDLISRTGSDVQIIAEGCTELLPAIIMAAFRFIFAAVILTVMLGKAALLFAAVCMGVFAAVALARNMIKGLHKGVQERYADNTSFLQETLSSLLMVKMFSAEEIFRDMYRKRQQDFMDFRMKRWFFHTAARTGLGLASGGVFFLILMAGSLGIFFGKFTLGSFIAVLQLITQLQAPFSEFPALLSRFYAIMASAERIEELRNIEIEDEERLPAEDVYRKLEAIVFDNVHFSYDDREVLKGLSGSIRKGETVAVKGPSGCGKSTLFMMILSGYAADEGSILLKFPEGYESDSCRYRSLFAYVPQGNYMMSGTVRDNITLFDKSISQEECDEALRISCASEFVAALPDGLDTQLNERGAGLSAGQLQRLSIARAVIKGAPVLLLDEATSALDDETEKKVLENIKGLKDRTVMIVTHGSAALQICDRVLFIEDGKFANSDRESSL